VKTSFHTRIQFIARGVVEECFGEVPTFIIPGCPGANTNLERKDETYARCYETLVSHLAYLRAAVDIDSPRLFLDYIAWLKILLHRSGSPSTQIAAMLTRFRHFLARDPNLDSRDQIIALQCLDHALNALPRMPEEVEFDIRPGQPHHELASRYRELVLAGQRREASQLIGTAFNEGISIKDIYLHIFQPALRDIGRLWQTNRITVAQEHYFTAATQMIMSQLYPIIFSAKQNGPTLVSACVSGELHEIGMRMLTDIFELEGWNTHYLGANMPSAGIVDTVLALRADVVAISATITSHLPLVREIVDTLRITPGCRDVRILVGGYPFNVSPELWRTVGADGGAPDALQALAVADRLLDRLPASKRGAV
jgi:methanogenic corrinoid protein MtbC1